MDNNSNKATRGGFREGSGRHGIIGNKHQMIFTEEEARQLNEMFPSESTIQEQLRKMIAYSYSSKSFGIINLLKVKCDENPDITLNFISKSFKNFEYNHYEKNKREYKDFEKNMYVCNKIQFNPLTEIFDIEIDCSDILHDKDIGKIDVKKMSREIFKKSRSLAEIINLIDTDDRPDTSKYNRYIRAIISQIEALIKKKRIIMSEIRDFGSWNEFRDYESWIEKNFIAITLELLKQKEIDFNTLIDILKQEYLIDLKAKSKNKLIALYLIVKQEIPNFLNKDNSFFEELHADPKASKSYISECISLEDLYSRENKDEFKFLYSNPKDNISSIINFPEAYAYTAIVLFEKLFKSNNNIRNYACFASIRDEFDKGWNRSIKTIEKKLSELNNLNDQLKKYQNNNKITLKIKSTNYTVVNKI